jgi:probable HAF family extracellular repeat protein
VEFRDFDPIHSHRAGSGGGPWGLDVNAGAWRAWGALALAIAVARSPAAGQCQYEVTVIANPVCQSLPYPTTVARGINDAGHVVGFYRPCVLGAPTAFVWTPEDGFVTLDLPNGAQEALANDISDSGEITGCFVIYDDDFSSLALYLDGVELVEIGVLPGGNSSEAEAARDGVVVGWSRSAASSRVAFVWQDGVLSSLAPDLGTLMSTAMDINIYGQVTGWMGTAVGQDGNAYVWDDGLVTMLPPIPGGGRGTGEAINNRGDVAGWGRRINEQTGELEIRGFAWIHDMILELPPIGQALWSSALDINDARQVVGRCWNGVPEFAVLWQGGIASNLNDLIVPGSDLGRLRIAYAINQRGQIAGYGSYTQGGEVGAVLTPVGRPPGDLNIDCRVGIVDLLHLLALWGPCDQTDDCPADLDGDSVVGPLDFLMLVVNWG